MTYDGVIKFGGEPFKTNDLPCAAASSEPPTQVVGLACVNQASKYSDLGEKLARAEKKMTGETRRVLLYWVDTHILLFFIQKTLGTFHM